MIIGDLLVRNANKFPHKLAVVSETSSLTFRELKDIIDYSTPRYLIVDHVLDGSEKRFARLASCGKPVINYEIRVVDKHWGEIVKAVIVQKEGVRVTEGEIIEFCGRSLAGFKKPKSVDFWRELPKSPQGKILKKEIRKHYGA